MKNHSVSSPLAQSSFLQITCLFVCTNALRRLCLFREGEKSGKSGTALQVTKNEFSCSTLLMLHALSRINYSHCFCDATLRNTKRTSSVEHQKTFHDSRKNFKASYIIPARFTLLRHLTSKRKIIKT